MEGQPVKRPTLDDLRVYFTKHDWETMDENEKFRNLDILDNFVGLSAMGLESGPPLFVKEYRERLNAPPNNTFKTFTIIPVKNVEEKMKQSENNYKNAKTRAALAQQKSKKQFKFIPPTLKNTSGMNSEILSSHNRGDTSKDKISTIGSNASIINPNTGKEKIDSEVNIGTMINQGASTSKGIKHCNESLMTNQGASTSKGVTHCDITNQGASTSKGVTHCNESLVTNQGASSSKGVGRQIANNFVTNGKQSMNQDINTSRESILPNSKENATKKVPDFIARDKTFKRLYEKYSKIMEDKLYAGRSDAEKKAMNKIPEAVRALHRFRAFKEGFLKGCITHSDPKVREAVLQHLEISKTDPIKNKLLQMIREVRGVDAHGSKADRQMEDEMIAQLKKTRGLHLNQTYPETNKPEDNKQKSSATSRSGFKQRAIPSHWKHWPEPLDNNVQSNVDNATNIPSDETATDIPKRAYPKRNIPRVDYTEPEDIDADRFLYCETCYREWLDGCPEHKTFIIPDKQVALNSEDRAKKTLPVELRLGSSRIVLAGTGVWTEVALPQGVVFGPYQGRKVKNPSNTAYSWQISLNGKRSHCIDGTDVTISNWMRYVNCARHKAEVNVIALQYRGEMYYKTQCFIPPKSELLVFYGFEYAASLGITRDSFTNPDMSTMKNEKFKCEKCNTCFTSPLYLTNHVTKCRARPKSSSYVDSSDYTTLGDNKHKCNTCNVCFTSPKYFHNHRCKFWIRRTNGIKENQKEQLNNDDLNNDENGAADNTDNIKLNMTNNISKHEKGTEIIILKSHQGDNNSINNCDLNNNIYQSNLIESRNGNKNFNNSIRAVHDKEKPFTCQLCDYSTSLKGSLTTHIRAVHDKEKPFTCQLCDYSTSLKGSLTTHIRAVHDKEKLFSCQLCDYSTSLKGSLTTHIRAVHDKEKPFTCQLCDYSTSLKGSLTTHIRAVHDKEKLFSCQLCDYSTSQKTSLTTHIRAVHDKEKPFTCQLCDYSASQKTSLTTHIRAVHDKEKLFSCQLCDYSTSLKGSLTTHIRAVHDKEKPFTCQLCDYSTSLKGSLTTHIRAVHDKEKPFTCQLCDYSTSLKGSLTTHIRAVHDKEKLFSCQLCDYSTSQKTSLTTHIRAVHDKEKPFTCQLCDYSASQKTSLTTHIRAVHDKEKPFTCQLCDYSVSCKGSLTTHIRAVHDKEKPFTCQLCDYSASQKTSLTTHIRAVHDKEKPFTCQLCDYSVSCKGSLTTHIRAVHDKEKPFTCQLCDYSTSQKGNLTTHIRAVHDKEKPFTCQLCDYSTSQKGNLTRHIRAVHDKEKPFTCQLCDYSTSQKGHLTTHIRAVHDKEKPFTCQLCDYSTSQKINLTSHIRAVHAKEKPFTCQLCDYSTSQKGHLTTHIRAVHDKEKPFTCQLCDYSTSLKGSLTTHIRAVHDKEKLFTCQLCDYSASQKTSLTTHIRAVHDKEKPFTR